MEQGKHGLGGFATDTPLATPAGWTTVGKVQPGDSLFDENGEPCRVVWAAAERSGRAGVRLSFDDGAQLVADSQNKWLLLPRHKRMVNRTRSTKDWREAWSSTLLVDTEEMALRAFPPCSANMNGVRTHWSIPLCDALATPVDLNLPLPPYVLGAWLGDGATRNAVMTTVDLWMLEEFQREGQVVNLYRPRPDGSTDFGFRPAGCDRPTGRANGGGMGALRNAGVLGAKAVPLRYLRASQGQRLALLQGFMDTDGFLGARGLVAIEQRDRHLVEGVVALARSLGWRAHRSPQKRPHPHRPGETYHFWNASFRPDLAPFRLPRKLREWESRLVWDRRFSHRTLVDIEHAADLTTRALKVDSPSELFLAGEGLVPVVHAEAE